MKRIVFALTLVLLLAPLCATAQVMNNNFIFPVVVRSPGSGGTMWKTEVCVTNPWSTNLVVGGAFIQGGQMDYAFVEFAPFATYCTQDLVKEWFFKDKWTGAFALYAPPELNTQAPRTAFAAIAKVYNDTPAGTYGTSVPVGQIIPEAWSMGSPEPFGMVSGVHNFGTAGVNGFRAAVGIFNPADFNQTISVFVIDSYGYVVWSKDISVPGWTMKQVSLPSGAQVANGSGIGVNNGGAYGTVPVFAYATVVDNKTGDGVFKPAMVFYENVSKANSTNNEVKEAEKNLMRKIFGDSLKVENIQIRRAGERMVPSP